MIYIGYDPRETEAYEVCDFSITSKSTLPTTPLKLSTVEDILTRPIEIKDGKMWCPISEAPMSTEFAISRFTIPFLEKEGWHLFIDCDMVCTVDIQELFDLADDKYAVMVVKHNQESGAATKMDGQIQTYYSRKNWSSVILWNCSHPANKKLTIEDLNNWPGRDLHAFKWLEDNEIGELPQEWNYLIGVSGNSPTTQWGQDIEDKIKIAHYTLGGPWLPKWEQKPTDRLWKHAYINFKLAEFQAKI